MSNLCTWIYLQWWRKRNIEPGRTNNHVDFVEFPRVVDDTLCHYFHDLPVYSAHIFEGQETISKSWSWAAYWAEREPPSIRLQEWSADLSTSVSGHGPIESTDASKNIHPGLYFGIKFCFNSSCPSPILASI